MVPPLEMLSKVTKVKLYLLKFLQSYKGKIVFVKILGGEPRKWIKLLKLNYYKLFVLHFYLTYVL